MATTPAGQNSTRTVTAPQRNATQEDEFVSFTNTSGEPVDISGWQIWSDWTGAGAPDSGSDGLYHTFPSGTVLAPGDTLFVINEISGTTPDYAQESSQGGVESDAGGDSTNYLSEGSPSTSESLVLVDPATGDYIVFNMSTQPSDVESFSEFPGTNKIGEVDAASVQEDQDAGSSYQYNSSSDSYTYGSVYVPCFARGTLIRTASGDRPVEDRAIGDLVSTLDNGPQPIRQILSRWIDFSVASHDKDRPIQICAGALGPDCPSSPLVVSPQHRMMVTLPCGEEKLAPAKGLIHLRGIRIKRGITKVQYLHLVFDDHQIVFGNDAPSESFLGGSYALTAASREVVHAMATKKSPARALMRVREVAQHL